jgi:2-hydroxycyclohexanecarboxyl-CoA dehydrogenase
VAGLLEGRVAVVTGGAGAIGGAICELFASEGADIVLGDIDEPRCRDMAERVKAHGRKSAFVAGDLTHAENLQLLAKIAQDDFGGADILINGLGHHLKTQGPFESTTEEQWQALYEVNLLHVFRATKLFLPAMKERGWGRIVNFSSVEGIRAAPGTVVYTAFKRGVDAFTKSVGVDTARFGVLVNSIAVDKTKAHQVGFHEMPEEYERLIPTWIPVGRYAEGIDIARVALFLASDLNTWIVGQTIVADGGTLSAGGWYRTPKRWTNQPLIAQWLEDDPEINERRPERLQ